MKRALYLSTTSKKNARAWGLILHVSGHEDGDISAVQAMQVRRSCTVSSVSMPCESESLNEIFVLIHEEPQIMTACCISRLMFAPLYNSCVRQ